VDSSLPPQCRSRQRERLQEYQLTLDHPIDISYLDNCTLLWHSNTLYVYNLLRDILTPPKLLYTITRGTEREPIGKTTGHYERKVNGDVVGLLGLIPR
jgi:hypothetical protein